VRGGLVGVAVLEWRCGFLEGGAPSPPWMPAAGAAAPHESRTTQPRRWRAPRKHIIPNYVVYWTFEPQQGVFASREFLFAAWRGGRCSSAPEPSCIEQTASAPTSGALLMCPFFAERPPIAVGIKGPMNFWVWYNSK
jgi:hypothetical protein